jgi:hypothetical protein
MGKSKILGYASQGGVRQHGGSLPVVECQRCLEAGHGGVLIVWATSKRTGKAYPCNVSHGYKGQRFYMGHDLHRCEDVARVAQLNEQARVDREERLTGLAEAQRRLAAMKEAGATDDEIRAVVAEAFEAFA